MPRSRAKVDVVHQRLAARLKVLMRRKHWSSNQFADFCGVGRGYVSDLLNGRKSPTVRTLVRLAEGLEVEVGDFFD